MAAQHAWFGLLMTSLLCLSLAIEARHDDTLVKNQEAATESYKSEDIFKNDKAQMPLTAKKQGHRINSCASRTAGEEEANEICGEDLGQSSLDAEEKITSSSYKQCEAEQPLRCQEEKAEYLGKNTALERHGIENLEQISEQVKDAEFSGNIIQRSMQGLEDMLGQVEKSGVKVFEKLGGVMDQVGLSREYMLERLDTVMGRVSESVSESKVRVIQGLDSLMDQVSASSTKMMEEIDHVIDTVAHSKVIEDIRAFPREIRESFVLSVRNRSYVAAGVMVAITTAILVAGAVYCAWCHQDAGSHHTVSLESMTDSKDKDHVNFKDKNGVICNDKDGVSSKGKDEINCKGKDDVNCKDKEDVNSKDKDDVSSKDEDDVSSKDEDDVSSKDEDDVNCKDKDDVSCKDKDDISSKEKDDVSSKDEDDVSSKDEDDVSSRDKDAVNCKDKDDVNSKDKNDANTKDSMNCEAAVKRSFSAQGLKSISNHLTAAVGFNEHPEGANTNSTGGASGQRASSYFGTKDFDGKGIISDVELQKVSVKGSDVSRGLVSSYPEEAVRSGVEVTQDVRQVQVRDIPKGDIPLKCQQKGMPSQDELQNNMTSEDEHNKGMPETDDNQRSMPFTDEHRSDSTCEPLLSQDKSHASTFVDVSCGFESTRDANIGLIKSENRQLGSSVSGLDSDDAVQDTQSDTLSLNISSTKGLRNMSHFTEVTGNRFEKGDSKNKYLQSIVSAGKAEDCGILGEGTISHQESVSLENRE